MTGIVKHYEDLSAADAVSAILTDIAHSGSSYSWSTNDLSVLEDMKKRLSKFNVHYVSDFDGRWEYVEPEEKHTSETTEPRSTKGGNSSSVHRNQFSVGELVVAVPNATNWDFFVEGIVTGIYRNMDDDILYEIECDSPVEGSNSKIEYRVVASRVFGSRLDMYIWAKATIEDTIEKLQFALCDMCKLIEEEKELYKEGEEK